MERTTVGRSEQERLRAGQDVLLDVRGQERGKRRGHGQDSLAGVPPNTLAARLKTLEGAGFVERKLYSESPPRLEYHLTEKGKTFGPVMRALREWGRRNT